MKVDFKKIQDKGYIKSLYNHQYKLDVELEEVYSLLDEYGVELKENFWPLTIQLREMYVGKKGILFSEKKLPSTEDLGYVLGLFIDKNKVYVILTKRNSGASLFVIQYYEYGNFKKNNPETCSSAVYHILTEIQNPTPNIRIGAVQNDRYDKALEDFLDYIEKLKNPIGNYDCVEIPSGPKNILNKWWEVLFNKVVIVPKDLRDRFFTEHDLVKYRAGESGYYTPICDVVRRDVHKFMKSKHQDLSTPQKIDKFNEELYELYVDIKKRYSWHLDKNSKDREWYTPENFVDFGLWEDGHKLWSSYNYPEYDPSMTIKYIEAKLGGKKVSTNFYNLTEKEMIDILKKNGKAPTYQVRFSKISGWNWAVYGAYVYKNELVLDIDILGDSTDMSETIRWKDFAKGSAIVRGVKIRIEPEEIKKVMNAIGNLQNK